MPGKVSLTEIETKLTHITRNIAETPISIEEET
jgi:hypothetical protein